MAVQTILQGDIPELRETSREVCSFDNDLRALLDNLADTLLEHRGVGLSAPQIGVHQRVVIIDVGNGIEVFINPEITESLGEVEGYESCLSFPEHTLKISRPQQITVRAQDSAGNHVERTVRDLTARVICHEVDHLNGVLFIDHVSDEELFTQLLSNSMVVEEGDEPDSPICPRPADTEIRAQQDELQMAVDMLSELSWKLVLSMEVLRDYHIKALKLGQLERMNETLDGIVGQVEDHIASMNASKRQVADTDA